LYANTTKEAINATKDESKPVEPLVLSRGDAMHYLSEIPVGQFADTYTVLSKSTHRRTAMHIYGLQAEPLT